jgi:hypothetical protein
MPYVLVAFVAGAISFYNWKSGDKSNEATDLNSIKILMIGDSHTVGSFGEGFRQELFKAKKTNEKKFFQYAVAGSSVFHWISGNFKELNNGYLLNTPSDKQSNLLKQAAPEQYFKSMFELAEKNSPDTIVIALGTNDMASAYMAGRKNDFLSVAQSLLDKVAELKKKNLIFSCVWIGPSLLRSKRFPTSFQIEYFDSLAQLLAKGPCLYLDSRQLQDVQGSDFSATGEGACFKNPQLPIAPDISDGVHFSKKKGFYWGRCLAKEWLQLNSKK